MKGGFMERPAPYDESKNRRKIEVVAERSFDGFHALGVLMHCTISVS